VRSADEASGDLPWPAIAAIVAAAALIHPLPFFLDDALFYPQIAFHIVRDGQSTFNGVTATNGYHPLWMLFNIATMWVSGLDKMLDLRILVGVEIAILAAALYFANRLMGRLQLRSCALGLSLLVLMTCTGLFGLETHLSLLMILLWENLLIECRDRDQTRNWALLGLASAGVCLARLDNIFLLVPGVMLAATTVPRLVRKGGLAAAVASPFVLPYLILNEVQFGHLVPISGAIKSGFPHPGFHPDFLGNFGGAMAIVAMVGFLVSFGSGLSARTTMMLQVNSAGTLLHAAYVVVFSIDPTTRSFWYYTVGIVNCALVMNVLASGSLRRVRATPARDLAIAALSGVMLLMATSRAYLKAFGDNVNFFNPSWIYRFDPERPGFQFMVADWISRNLPAGSRIIAVDFPGALAYRTNSSIIALDGLTNDFAYDRELSGQGIANFVARCGVDYYFGPRAADGERVVYGMTLTHGGADSQSVAVFAPVSHTMSGSLEFDRDAMLVDVRAELGETGHGNLAVWKIDHAKSVLPTTSASPTSEPPTDAYPCPGS